MVVITTYKLLDTPLLIHIQMSAQRIQDKPNLTEPPLTARTVVVFTAEPNLKIVDKFSNGAGSKGLGSGHQSALSHPKPSKMVANMSRIKV